MKEVNVINAIRRYNRIMVQIGREYNVIEIGADTEHWNLRDMVAECDYQLSTYYESNHVNSDLRFESLKQWKSEVGKLERFIKAYEPNIKEMKCTTRHSSKYDN